MSAVKTLNPEVARKIAAGEVIDRPNAIIRELMDNAVDSKADRISVEISQGGIERIRVIDNGCGMTREDLENCARPHATSKISTETDLMNLTTLGFRGEALSSMAAVSRLEIISGGYKMQASVTKDHIITPAPSAAGTIVQTSGLFENFPARRHFLKRPASEALMCRSTFLEKALPRPDIAFSFTSDGEEKFNFPSGQSLSQRFVQAMELFESENLFYEEHAGAPDGSWKFTIILGDPAVCRSSRKDIYIYVNGRRIQEYSLIQAIEYGATGYFPNGTHPVACLFATVDPSLVDFNIHPAKREARFKDIAPLHHGVSTTVKNFYRHYTVKSMYSQAESETPQNLSLKFSEPEQQSEESEEKKDSAFPPATPSTSGYNSNSPYNRLPYSITSPGTSTKHSYTASRTDTRSSFFEKKSTASSYARELAEELNSTYENSIIAKKNWLPSKTDKDDGFHFTGSALGTFLIAEKNNTLYIIDQHAAHERILYNQILEDASQKQELLVPYVIKTSGPQDDNYLEEIKESLCEAGFTVKRTGESEWQFTTVPLRWKGTEKDLENDLLAKRINPRDILNATAASTACRQAVMDGTVLDEETAADLAKKALQLPDPHCPHGRPVFTTITRNQLFALVKRT
ncbi:DNA mismatch repair endonuclease MutL [Treponema sp.]|uniref:DNA mismatch repair endonuclease MutL n=1 Tax=Treponema sp. TaxID=166 RepID=UPI00257E0193|nr:DNA mismatch repair endonuclease MutL [Treponema sp.]MBE6354617.1 DNA mismatch repair endonuclease MutL [Treponema sp.]